MPDESSRTEVAAAIERINRAWRDRCPDDLAPLFHPALTVVFPGFSGRAEGRDAAVAGFADFCAQAVVREYTETHYLPLASAYRARSAERERLGTQLAAWRQALAAHWPEARFGDLRAESHGADRHISVSVPVHLGGLEPETVRVELYANPGDDGRPERHAMERTRALDEAGGFEYRVTIPATRAVGDYTPRLLPNHSNASIPLEAPEILWQR